MYANNAVTGNVASPNQKSDSIEQVIPKGGMFSMDIERAEGAPPDVIYGAIAKPYLATPTRESLDKKDSQNKKDPQNDNPRKAKGFAIKNPFQSSNSQGPFSNQLGYRSDERDNPVERSSIHSGAKSRYRE